MRVTVVFEGIDDEKWGTQSKNSSSYRRFL